MVSFGELIENPAIVIGFLISFIGLLVPTTKQIYLQVFAEYASESGYGFIGNPILFVQGIVGDFFSWLVLTFLDLVIHLAVVAFVGFTFINTFVQIFRN
ncbi:hypothetical protein [Methanococcoides sp. FTZ1]|uniref:hypothetical protein n=1 Tax=Methanococcoides sp. FTZ1 TaxID=3439061 RepID=UPI003F8735B6